MYWAAHSLQSLGKDKRHLCFIESAHNQYGLDAVEAVRRLRSRLKKNIFPVVLIHPECADTIPMCEDELFPAINSIRPLNMWYRLKESGVFVRDYKKPEELIKFIRENIQRLVETLSKD